jgi:hypothetical protein
METVVAEGVQLDVAAGRCFKENSRGRGCPV